MRFFLLSEVHTTSRLNALSYSAIELQVLNSAAALAVELTAADVDVLLANPSYHPSLGDPATARHYRRSLANGGCLHLVIHHDAASLHFDSHDPHHSPAHLVAHLMQESPAQAYSLLAAAVALLRRVSAR
jgi:hypothetical protein